MNQSYNQVKKTLFEEYYSIDNTSSVTSSHWQQHGQNVILNTNDEITPLTGDGFGDYSKKNLFNLIRFLPESLLLKGYLKKHCFDSTLLSCGFRVIDSTQRLLSFDSCKQIVALSRIIGALKTLNKANALNRVCIIGDGHGFMSSLIKEVVPTAKVYCVNLGKQLLFDTHFTGLSHPSKHVRLTKNFDANETFDFEFIEAERFQVLREVPIDLYINIASMQEMNFSTINQYFDIMRNSPLSEKFFYCCNRKNKTLPDGENINFSDYPWGSHEVLIDSTPEWYRYYPTKIPPFWKSFDGPHRERFIRFKS